MKQFRIIWIVLIVVVVISRPIIFLIRVWTGDLDCATTTWSSEIAMCNSNLWAETISTLVVSYLLYVLPVWFFAWLLFAPREKKPGVVVDHEEQQKVQ